MTRKIEESELDQCSKELDIYGFCSIRNFLTDESLNNLLQLVNHNYEEINKNGLIKYPGTPDRDGKDKIIYNIQNLDIAFLEVLTSPSITSIASKKLNDPYYRYLPADKPNFILQYYNARSSGSKLDLHIDSHIPFAGDYTNMMQFVILLEDSFVDNGCTVVVPGSHKSGSYTDRNLENVKSLEGKAGDLIFWDSRLWHGTHPNIVGRSRWALIATISMWWVKPSMDIVRSMNDDIYMRCTDQQKQFLGFCAVPPIDPMERNNTKCGYDFLKSSVKDYNF
jgi:ectoine hydroxylase-related dioxygenase (phytanoyl-CoA dioxygenase family)